MYIFLTWINNTQYLYTYMCIHIYHNTKLNGGGGRGMTIVWVLLYYILEINCLYENLQLLNTNKKKQN